MRASTQEMKALDVDAIISQIEHILITERLGKESGDRIEFLCPAHDDHDPSASWSRSKQVWNCFACDGQGGYINLAGHLGVELPSLNGASGIVESRWDLFDFDGSPIGVPHIRKDYPDGRKKRYYWGEYESGGLGDRSSKDLLYGAELVKSFLRSEPVIIVEGEKAADALRTFGFQVVATVCGATSTPSRSVLAHFDGFDVYLWPDNDSPGRSHMNRIGSLLSDPPLLIVWSDSPDKGDAADLVEQGGTKEQVELLMAAALLHSKSEAPDDSLPSFPINRKEGSESRIELRRFSDLLSEPLKDIEYLWDGRLPKGGISIFAARPKAGKTITALNLATKVCAGEPFLGFGNRKSPVVYLALEGSQTEILRQLQSMGAPVNSELHMSFGAITTTNPIETAEVVKSSIIETQAGFVVVDTMARLFPYVQDLNDYAQVMRALAPMEAVARQTGAHMMFLYHQGKGQSASGEISMLGSTAIFAVPDTAIEIVRDKDDRRTLRTQQRYGDDLEPIVVHQDESFVVTSRGSAEEAQRREILDNLINVLESDGEISASELAEKVPGKTTDYYTVLREAKASQIVLERSESRKTLYSLNPKYLAQTGIGGLA